MDSRKSNQFPANHTDFRKSNEFQGEDEDEADTDIHTQAYHSHEDEKHRGKVHDLLEGEVRNRHACALPKEKKRILGSAGIHTIHRIHEGPRKVIKKETVGARISVEENRAKSGYHNLGGLC